MTATRIFDGQSRGLSGEEHVLPFETFPNVALVKTYNTNQQVPDSAGTITAMLTGTKTRAGMLNVAPGALRESCEDALDNRLEPISVPARRQGKAIGIVTTARLTHATPAAVFASSHMTYMAEKDEYSTEPTLTQMATTAVRILREEDDGYFLLVEGGRIDHGHHDGKPGYALLEAQEFANAVAAVLEMVDVSETLVLVTADHSHVFTLGGYPTRGNPILGLVVQNDATGRSKGVPQLADDGQPYTTVAYANGLGAQRILPRGTPSTGINMLAQSLVPVFNENDDGTVDYDETHAGEDVAIYAIGPGAEGVRGVIEQDRIYDIMIEAFGWGG